MKHLFLFSLLSVMFVACNSNKSSAANSESTSDSLSTVESVAQASAVQTFVLTDDGVGSLKMMQPFKDMSKSDEGLYNKVEKETSYDESSGLTFTNYTLYLNEEKVAGFSIPDAKAPIVMLYVYSPRLAMANGVKVGMPLRDFVKKDGVKANLEEDVMGESAIGYCAWISIGKVTAYGWWSDVDILTKSGKAKLSTVRYDKPAKLLPEDIKPEEKVTELCVYRKDD